MEQWKNQGKGAGRLFRGLTAAFLTTVVLLLAFAFALLQFAWDDGKTEIGILIIYIVSCIAGGWFCGHRAARRRFLWGLLTGLLYFVLLFAVSSVTDGTTGPALSDSILTLFLCAGGGMLGGMIS